MTDAAQLHRLSSDPAAFRRALVLDNGQRFQPDSWQETDFEALDSAWKRVAGHAVPLGCQRGYLERPRGHSKTFDLAVSATWTLAFSRRRNLNGIAAAADREQARLLRDSIARIVSNNAWLSELLSVQQIRVSNEHSGAILAIISSDTASSYGILPDFLVCDELVHWTNEGLWHSLLSAAAKREHCLLLVISNAGLGMGVSWQWHVRESVRTDPAWYFSRLDSSSASWISQERLAEQERLLPGPAYARLWQNTWSQDGDAIPLSRIDQAIDAELRPQLSAQPGFIYVGGLDLSLTTDFSAFCVLGKSLDSGRMVLAHTRLWRPFRKHQIDLQEIETHVAEVAERFSLGKVLADQYQAAQLCQRLSARGLKIEGVNFTPQLLREMASAVIGGFNDGAFTLYRDEDLLRDLRRAQVHERGYGIRLEWPRDKDGHGDLGTSFALAAVAARSASTIQFPQLHGEAFDREMEAARIKWAALYEEFDATQPPDWGFASR